MKRDMQEGFLHPSKEYSPAAFWFWYGRLEKEKLSWQLDEMADKGVYNAFMHPRAYLVTPYLEEEWWEMISHTVAHAQKAGVRPWLYDEYAWPSGTAGSTFPDSPQIPSRVLAKGEVNMAKGLYFREGDFAAGSVLPFPEESERPLIVLFVSILPDGTIEKPVPLMQNTDGSITLPAPGHIMAFYRRVYSGHVDYLNEDTIALFIQLTHEAYRQRYGELFGKVIPGIFFDEIYNAARPIVWTDRFAQAFSEANGYDLLPLLPYLIYDGAEAKAVRYDYFEMLSSLYEKAFFKQIGDWCEKYNLRLTGHTEEGLAMHPLRQGHFFRTMKHLQIPGSDCHDYRYTYPRHITYTEPKYSVSVAHLYGKERITSESMGGAGWGTPMQEFKRGINVTAAMGTNNFVLHGFHYELDHQGSQADWPSSFFFQNPYWKYFRHFSDYVSRICYMHSMGRPKTAAGVLYPVASLWEHYANGQPDAAGQKTAADFQKVLHTLLEHQIDTDMIDEDSIANARVEDGMLHMGQLSLHLLVLDAGCPLKDTALAKLQQFHSQGGALLLYGKEKGVLPQAFPLLPILEESGVGLMEAVLQIFTPVAAVSAGECREIFIHHRETDDQQVFFIANGIAQKRNITLTFRCGGLPCLLDPETGFTLPAIYRAAGESTVVELSLQPDQGLFVVFGHTAPPSVQEPVWKNICTLDNWQFIPQGDVKIPVAEFSWEGNDQWQPVRICNKEGEPGYCGRHMSLWKAGWISRRPHWTGDTSPKELYFRKKFTLSAPILEASLCFVAVSSCTLFVNGHEVHTHSDWQQPVTVNIAPYLLEGENLLAFKVVNPSAQNRENFNELAQLPADALISLLVQGTVRTAAETVEILSDTSFISSNQWQQGWETLSLDAESTALYSDPKAYKFFWSQNSAQWLQAWERGKPPLLPFGDLPLFGHMPQFPALLRYKIALPKGTVSLKCPQVKGDYTLSWGGQPLTAGESISLDARSGGELLLEVQALDASCGLLAPLEVQLEERGVTLPHDWCKDGLSWLSGRCVYTADFTAEETGQYQLDMGCVNFYAEIFINGQKVTDRIWEPYTADISAFVQKGKNTIRIVVSNQAANSMYHSLLDEGAALGWNHYWYKDNIERDAQNLISGLQSGVTVRKAESLK